MISYGCFFTILPGTRYFAIGIMTLLLLFLSYCLCPMLLDVCDELGVVDGLSVELLVELLVQVEIALRFISTVIINKREMIILCACMSYGLILFL